MDKGRHKEEERRGEGEEEGRKEGEEERELKEISDLLV